jgi:hypothetical protein
MGAPARRAGAPSQRRPARRAGRRPYKILPTRIQKLFAWYKGSVFTLLGRCGRLSGGYRVSAGVLTVLGALPLLGCLYTPSLLA